MKDGSFKLRSFVLSRRKEWREFGMPNRPKRPSLCERIAINMFYVYLLLSAVLVLTGNAVFGLFAQSWAWWATPLIFAGVFITLCLLHILLTVISGAVVNVNKPVGKTYKYYRFLADTSIAICLKFARVKIDTEGTDMVPRDGRFLLVCNHQHDFDPAIIMNALPGSELGFIAKKEIYKTLVLISKLMHKIHCIPIDRENNREAAQAIIKAVKLIEEDKASIGIFPEGYVSKSCDLLPMRNGAFKIAFRAKVPIVVCVINNTRSIPKNMFRRRTHVTFKVLEVIDPPMFEEIGTTEIGERVFNEMNEALTEIRSQKTDN